MTNELDQPVGSIEWLENAYWLDLAYRALSGQVTVMYDHEVHEIVVISQEE